MLQGDNSCDIATMHSISVFILEEVRSFYRRRRRRCRCRRLYCRCNDSQW